ncbi:MAG: hypothetical protein JWO67_6606, partial [Streptosporangiaceae bacterium]|nr:hypothetical protein [Streptosporangiaceae bacterium]
MYQTTQQPPRKKPRNWKLIGGIAGGILILGIIGSLTGHGTSSTTTTTSVSSPSNSATAEDKAATKAAPATLPNLVGMGLQSAQDTAQAAGFYGLSSHDSLGRARHQVLDRDWKV